MYAVIKAGGKQYRVAPGDVIKVEKLEPRDGQVEFTDVLAVSGDEGQLDRPEAKARVVGEVVAQGRGDKVLVFHYKRKKQYKKLAGHRQPFTQVRITEIDFDGQRFTAPGETKARPTRAPKAAEGGAASDEATVPKRTKKAQQTKEASPTGAGSYTKAQHGGTSKMTGTKSKGGKPPSPKKKK
jgi:large subunit ribosomal protein L21